MQNVQEKKTVEDLTAEEAVQNLKLMFESIQNPFSGSVREVKQELITLEKLFNKIEEAVKVTD